MNFLFRIPRRLFPRSDMFDIGGSVTKPPPLIRKEEASAL